MLVFSALCCCKQDDAGLREHMLCCEQDYVGLHEQVLCCVVNRIMWDYTNRSVLSGASLCTRNTTQVNYTILSSFPQQR